MYQPASKEAQGCGQASLRVFEDAVAERAGHKTKPQGISRQAGLVAPLVAPSRGCRLRFTVIVAARYTLVSTVYSPSCGMAFRG